MAKVRGMFRRGNVWWLRYTPAPGHPQQRISLDTGIEQLAAAKALAILHAPPIEKSSEFEVELEHYLEEAVTLRRMAPVVAANRRYTLKAFALEFGIRRLTDVTTEKVTRWVHLLRQGGGGKGAVGKREPISLGSISTYIFNLRAFWRWLLKRNKVRDNPAAEVELGKIEFVVRKNFLSVDAVRKLITDAPHDDLRFILFCGFHAGMRKMEIVEARPSWFQLGDGKRRGVINIHATATFSVKDREAKSVPLSTEFESFLRGYLAKLPTGAEFVLRPEVKHGRSQYRYDFEHPFKKYFRSAGVKGFSPHDMRRTFVSNKVIENSSLIFKLAKWTGTNVTTLQAHYAHLLADDADIDVGLGELLAPDLQQAHCNASFDDLLGKVEKLSEEVRLNFLSHVRDRIGGA